MSYSQQMIDAIQNEELEEADTLLDQALNNDSTDELYLLADSLYQLGFLDDTKKVLYQLLESNPADDEIRINLAEIEIEEDNDLEAIDLLNEIDETSEAYVQSLLVLADYYQVNDLSEISEQKLLEAKEILPEEPVIIFALGELYYSMSRFNQAIRQYEDLYNQNIDEMIGIQIASRLGATYSATGNFEVAVQYLQEAIDQKEDIDTIFQLGLTYFQQEEYVRANETFNQVKTLDNTYTSLYPYLARGLEEELQLDKAAEVVNEGIYLDKTNSQLYVIGANIEVKRNNFEKADEYFNEAIRLSPDNESIRIEYTNFLIYIEKYDEAIALIQNALTEQDADPQFYWNLAIAQNELEEFDAARNAFQKAYPAFEYNSDFLKEYIIFLQEDGQPERLQEVGQRYLTIQPEDIEVRDILNRFEDF